MISGVSSISGKVVENVFMFIFGISVIFLVLITFFMVYFAVKYNRKKNISPVNIEGNMFLEITWTVIPTILVLAMFYYGWVGYKTLQDVPEEAINVKVKARMWSWLFEYKNGKQSDVLYVPVGNPVKLTLLSQDVIHSFYIPAFRVKQDIVPGMKTYLWFESTRLGSYDVMCAEYCGLNHSGMLSKVIVMPEKEFREWYDIEKIIAKKERKPEKKVVGEDILQLKGCVGCHTTDGSPLVGPTFKGIYGHKVTVITDGKEREIEVDEEYLRKSLIEPNADVVKGFPPIMPSQKGLLTEEEITEIIEYLKGLK